ncbi:hypothetical protein BC351_20560 [Paenibacillus ferrarius]|uniref:Beta-carotene 15,15'-monooxygenase n=1 Tax=Paenibacillus ferrarius TaxID=1469647 RepID=A0A1V4HNE1_9BACL|nr:hypothetical protein [Paenibacillus ferrarius]OPH59307.1 hypothetical protein BC351_20560 [Paenibacillus ferrarius]
MFKLYKSNIGYFLGISLFIILIDFVIVKSQMYQANNQLLTVGIALDFIAVIPLLLYFLIYRKINKKIISILPFAFFGYIALQFLIPHTGQETLEFVKYTLIPLELLFLCYEGYKIFQIINYFRANRATNRPPLEIVRKAIEGAFNNSKIASLLVHDVSIFYYAIMAWRKKPYVRTGAASFSYHKNSSWLITILILSKILLIEGVCIHLLLSQWSPTVAWLLSLGNIYIIFLLIADYRAMCLNPILLSNQSIRIQYGIQLSSPIDIDIANIASVSIIHYKKLTKHDLKTSVTPLVIEPNVLIQLKNEITMIRLFGKRQIVDRLYLFMDEPDEFYIECYKYLDK